jgi:hypothetical protein
MKPNTFIFLGLVIIFLAGCAVTVTYRSEPPGATIMGEAHGGGLFHYVTPMTLNYPSVTQTFNQGTCPIIMSPTARWPDGTTLEPIRLQLCNRDSIWILYKPAQTYHHNPPPTHQNLQSSGPDSPQASLEDAKRKCTELGFKAGTEKFGKCALQLSK